MNRPRIGCARLVERINNLRVGHSLDPKADYGPLITSAALARVKNYIAQGVEAGAEVVVDGRERASDDLTFGDVSLEGGYFIGPTLFDHVTTDMSIYQDEIFSPVLCIVRANDYEEALALPSEHEHEHEHEYGNGAAIFTRDGDTARDFTSRVQVGMVGVNVPIPVPVAHHTLAVGSGPASAISTNTAPRRSSSIRRSRPSPSGGVGHQGRRRVQHPDHEIGEPLTVTFSLSQQLSCSSTPSA